jgi:glycosyltransferase involved in cell wall biosynthesis
MTTSLHCIDVVIPVYNGAQFIRQALDSVALQGDILATIIVVNDGSTDATADLVTQVIHEHPQLAVELIKQNNAGLAAARNTGIRYAKAPFIAFLDADDLWLANKLQLQYQLFLNSTNPKLGVIYCAYGTISEAGERISNTLGNIVPKVKGDIYRQLRWGNFVSGSGSSVLIRRSLFETIGLFDETLTACEDWDMWLRIAKQFHFDFVAQELVLIRLHAHNMQKNTKRMIGAELMMLNKFVQARESNPFLLWKLRTMLLDLQWEASNIPGFEQCHPDLQNQLTGWRNAIAKAILRPFQAFALQYLQKKALRR